MEQTEQELKARYVVIQILGFLGGTAIGILLFLGSVMEPIAILVTLILTDIVMWGEDARNAKVQEEDNRTP